MKNQNQFKRLLFACVLILFLSAFSETRAQGPITCPYPVTNNLTCPARVSYELLNNACQCPAGCGPYYNILVSGNSTTFLGNSTQCAASGWDIILHVDNVGMGANPSVYLDGGCVWNVQSDTKSKPFLCGGGNYTVTWTSTGAVIN